MNARRRTQQGIINSILSSSKGLRASVNAHCVSCIYDDCVEGTWRQQVELCTVTSCPFYAVRPKRGAKRPLCKMESSGDAKPLLETDECEEQQKTPLIAVKIQS